MCSKPFLFWSRFEVIFLLYGIIFLTIFDKALSNLSSDECQEKWDACKKEKSTFGAIGVESTCDDVIHNKWACDNRVGKLDAPSNQGNSSNIWKFELSEKKKSTSEDNSGKGKPFGNAFPQFPKFPSFPIWQGFAPKPKSPPAALPSWYTGGESKPVEPTKKPPKTSKAPPRNEDDNQNFKNNKKPSEGNPSKKNKPSASPTWYLGGKSNKQDSNANIDASTISPQDAKARYKMTSESMVEPTRMPRRSKKIITNSPMGNPYSTSQTTMKTTTIRPTTVRLGISRSSNINPTPQGAVVTSQPPFAEDKPLNNATKTLADTKSSTPPKEDTKVRQSSMPNWYSPAATEPKPQSKDKTVGPSFSTDQKSNSSRSKPKKSESVTVTRTTSKPQVVTTNNPIEGVESTKTRVQGRTMTGNTKTLSDVNTMNTSNARDNAASKKSSATNGKQNQTAEKVLKEPSKPKPISFIQRSLDQTNSWGDDEPPPHPSTEPPTPWGDDSHPTRGPAEQPNAWGNDGTQQPLGLQKQDPSIVLPPQNGPSESQDDHRQPKTLNQIELSDNQQNQPQAIPSNQSPTTLPTDPNHDEKPNPGLVDPETKIPPEIISKKPSQDEPEKSIPKSDNRTPEVLKTEPRQDTPQNVQPMVSSSDTVDHQQSALTMEPRQDAPQNGQQQPPTTVKPRKDTPANKQSKVISSDTSSQQQPPSTTKPRQDTPQNKQPMVISSNTVDQKPPSIAKPPLDAQRNKQPIVTSSDTVGQQPPSIAKARQDLSQNDKPMVPSNNGSSARLEDKPESSVNVPQETIVPSLEISNKPREQPNFVGESTVALTKSQDGSGKQMSNEQSNVPQVVTDAKPTVPPNAVIKDELQKIRPTVPSSTDEPQQRKNSKHEPENKPSIIHSPSTWDEPLDKSHTNEIQIKRPLVQPKNTDDSTIQYYHKTTSYTSKTNNRDKDDASLRTPDGNLDHNVHPLNIESVLHKETHQTFYDVKSPDTKEYRKPVPKNNWNLMSRKKPDDSLETRLPYQLGKKTGKSSSNGNNYEADDEPDSKPFWTKPISNAQAEIPRNGQRPSNFRNRKTPESESTENWKAIRNFKNSGRRQPSLEQTKYRDNFQESSYKQLRFKDHPVRPSTSDKRPSDYFNKDDKFGGLDSFKNVPNNRESQSYGRYRDNIPDIPDIKPMPSTYREPSWQAPSPRRPNQSQMDMYKGVFNRF